MLTAVFFALKITLIHLAGAYLRYVSFSKEFSRQASLSYWKKIAVVSLILTCFYVFQFLDTAIDVRSYKTILLFGWIPYQYLFVRAMPNQGLSHLFVFSMFAMWTFILHSLACLALALFFMEQNEEFVLQLESALYIAFYLVLLPLARHYFRSLLEIFSRFTRRGVKIYFALLPLVMTAGYLAMINDGILWHSWEERLARLLLPVAFFIIYHYILATSQHIYEQKHLLHNSAIMKQELLYLEEARLLAADNREQMQKHLSGLLDTYKELRQLLQQGKIKEAQAYISQQEDRLSATAIIAYTDYSIINAAISIYLHRAKTAGIGIIQKINLPRTMGTDENDLAVLLANLLENALLASAKDNGARQITLILQHNGDQCVLEIANTFKGTLHLGEDGLPKTSRDGHGIGMLSLKNFLDKYDGYADFSCENGWVRLTMYWEDQKPC